MALRKVMPKQLHLSPNGSKSLTANPVETFVVIDVLVALMHWKSCKMVWLVLLGQTGVYKELPLRVMLTLSNPI